MDDPIKIIFKFKNDRRRTQHHVYIFIGDVSPNIQGILNKIKNLSLYDSLIELDKNEYNKLEKKYGKFWYKKFFITHHINFTIYNIRKSKQNEKELVDKYGKQWLDDHISSHKLIEKKIFYSFEALIKDEKMRQEKKKENINHLMKMNSLIIVQK
jgi:hypothetical protein